MSIRCCGRWLCLWCWLWCWWVVRWWCCGKTTNTCATMQQWVGWCVMDDYTTELNRLYEEQRNVSQLFTAHTLYLKHGMYSTVMDRQLLVDQAEREWLRLDAEIDALNAVEHAKREGGKLMAEGAGEMSPCTIGACLTDGTIVTERTDRTPNVDPIEYLQKLIREVLDSLRLQLVDRDR